jgi:hypothetical protein
MLDGEAQVTTASDPAGCPIPEFGGDDCPLRDAEPLFDEAEAEDVDRIASAQQVFENFKMMWDDEVGRAESIRDKRKLYATGIALLLGVGVIRISWYRSTRDVAAISDPNTAFYIKMVLAAAVAVLLVSAYRMFTERRLFRPGACRILPFLARWPLLGPDPDVQERQGRAIVALDMSLEEAEDQLRTSPELVWLGRAFRVRKAYGILVKANDRVNQRINDGVILLGISFLLLSVAIVWYSLALDTRRITDASHQGEEAPAEVSPAERPSGAAASGAPRGNHEAGKGAQGGSPPGATIVPGGAPLGDGNVN